MVEQPTIHLIIPALDEEASIGDVVRSVPALIDKIHVVDNGSRDQTGKQARQAGAHVVRLEKAGYGRACLAGIAAASEADIIVFMDGDGSDDPAEMEMLLQPILSGQADLVIGSRVLGDCEPGSFTPQQRWGNWLACRLMSLIWGFRFTDLGPFRAIRREALDGLGMADETYGWTVEMQIKALKRQLRCREVPVSYRRRVGQSKISGTVKGVILAGTKILWTIFRLASQRLR